jgi:nucleoside-diphosphate-sugar epimerase
MKKVVAISGAAGFVGRKLAYRLAELDFEVIALDLINPEIENVSFQYFDISKDLEPSSVNIPEESIFVHLAAMSTDSLCKENPVKAVSINLTGTARVVELVNQSHCSRLIFASSEWVYPELQDSKLQEEDDPLRLEDLQSLYAMTKLMGENIVRTTCTISNVTLRFGIVYGPREKAGSAPESIAYKISKGENVTLGAGSTARRFIFVEDLIDGICSAITVSLPKSSSVYNLSGNELINLMTIAKTAQEITDQRVQIIDKGGEPSIRNPDPSNFMKDFGFSPKFSISAGLNACLAVMK